MAVYCKQSDFVPLPADPAGKVKAELERIRTSNGKTRPYTIRKEMREIMMSKVGVFREESIMQEALDTVRELKETFQTDLAIDDRGYRFNTDLLEAWELGCLLDTAEVITASALNRKESRGAHSREDFPKRDDEKYLAHTMAYPKDGDIDIQYDRPVDLSLGHEPKERVY